MIPKPLFCLAEVPSQSHRVQLGEPGEVVSCGRHFAIEKCFDKVRYILGAKGAHGNGQMEAVIKMSILVLTNGLKSSAGPIFAVGQPGGDVHVPTRELRLHRFDP